MSKWIELLRGQNGNSSNLRLRKMWHTEKPSIQGVWTPFTHKNTELNLVVFPNENVAKPLDVEKTASETLLELFEQQKLNDSSSLDENRAK